MAALIHGFDWPDRFVVGAVGHPGARTFYLQAREGSQVVSVALEKEQSAALAERLEEVLDTLMAEEGNPFSVPALTPDGLADDQPLDLPVVEQFRTGTMSLGWDPSTAQIVIEAFPMPPVDDDTGMVLDDVEPEEVLVVRIPVGAARAFAQRTRQVVGAGRPICSLCDVPMDPGHECVVPDDFT